MQPAKEIILEWVHKGQEDELNIESQLKHRDGTPSLTCFVAQQMAEKYLKALVLFFTNDAPKIHTLPKLASLIESRIPGTIELLADELAILDPLYIATRYPANDITPELFTWEMAQQAHQAAIKIKNFVMENIRL